MTIHRIDRWNLEIRDANRKVLLPVEASYDGSILSVFLDRVANWAPPQNDRLAPEERALIRRELERSYAGSGVRLEFDPEQ